MNRPAIVTRGLPLLLLLVAACGTPRQPGSRTPDVGEPAPALSLRTATGDHYSLEDARKEGPVVVVFYRGLF